MPTTDRTTSAAIANTTTSTGTTTDTIATTVTIILPMSYLNIPYVTQQQYAGKARG